uniref:Uncharacterized protein n=1 Tax=Cucumis sativus TaxID=3659 RepID=A0A0A0LIP3_CUCSA
MEYLGSADFSNYGTNWFHTRGKNIRSKDPNSFGRSFEKREISAHEVLKEIYSI